MKEVTAAVKALRDKADTYNKLADALMRLDRYAESLPKGNKKRKLSVAARKRIAQAQKKRWAKWHREHTK